MPVVTNISNPAASLPVVNLSDIRDIKPPVVISSGWELLWWTLAVLVLLGIITAVVFLWLAKRRKPEIALMIPPHERARRKLEAALDLYDQPKPFCILVSDAVRFYLEECFGLHAPDRTTDEFLDELKRSKALTPQQKESLEQFLSACDLVKFARHEPGRLELESLYKSALRLIAETEPHPQPVAQPAATDAQRNAA